MEVELAAFQEGTSQNRVSSKVLGSGHIIGQPEWRKHKGVTALMADKDFLYVEQGGARPVLVPMSAISWLRLK